MYCREHRELSNILTSIQVNVNDNRKSLKLLIWCMLVKKLKKICSGSVGFNQNLRFRSICLNQYYNNKCRDILDCKEVSIHNSLSRKMEHNFKSSV